ncbi:hypothetical protein LCGC14_2453160 [marine sediment metagenome]|uniref:Uncharacterized protein n=1 Tax=marine sediment metagenome TaxID=412755 RepID=A0A0F9C326_9ZZZZ
MKEETVQFKILTMHLCCSDEWNNINPFYKRSRQEILDNFEYAKKIYKEVLKRFTSTWCFVEAHRLGMMPDTDYKTIEKYGDKIIEAIHDHKILPYPQEWNELKV